MTGRAIVSRLPQRKGEYEFIGGEYILAVGARAVIFGPEPEDEAFALGMAEAWNEKCDREEFNEIVAANRERNEA